MTKRDGVHLLWIAWDNDAEPPALALECECGALHLLPAGAASVLGERVHQVVTIETARDGKRSRFVQTLLRGAKQLSRREVNMIAASGGFVGRRRRRARITT